MSSLSLFLITLSLFSLPTSQGHESSNELRLMHRVVHPDLPVIPWSELGTVALRGPFESVQPTGSHASLSLAKSFPDDLADFAEAVNPKFERGMYHVAIESPRSPDGAWALSNIKAVGRAFRIGLNGLICCFDFI